MKKRSYDQGNSASESENDEPDLKLGAGGAVQAFREAKQAEEAYRNIEITPEVFTEKLEYLREIYWECQIDI
jgi:hypothetical protein